MQGSRFSFCQTRQNTVVIALAQTRNGNVLHVQRTSNYTSSLRRANERTVIDNRDALALQFCCQTSYLLQTLRG